ncbi:hypothetical protein [Streptomyces sp. B4I13]|nr:hypothetical protein [Streptomyces sp. B4I13]
MDVDLDDNCLQPGGMLPTDLPELRAAQATHDVMTVQPIVRAALLG